MNKKDREEALYREHGRLQELMEKSIKEKNDEWIEVRLQQKKLEEELNELS